MESEIAASPALLEVRIVGVNMAADANIPLPQGFGLPMAQDLPEIDMWATWGVQWRDVILVDERNNGVGIPNIPRNTLNLSFFDLGKPENYATLKEILLLMANPVDNNGNRIADTLEEDVFGSILEGEDLTAEQLERLAFVSSLEPLQLERVTSVDAGTSAAALLRTRRRAYGSIRPRTVLEISTDGSLWSANPSEILGTAATEPAVSIEPVYDGSGSEWVEWSWEGLPESLLFRVRTDRPAAQ